MNRNTPTTAPERKMRRKRKMAILRLTTFCCIILAAVLAVALGVSAATTGNKVAQLSEQVEQLQKNLEEKDALLKDALEQNTRLAEEKAAAEKAKEDAEKALKDANEVIAGYQSAGKPYNGPKVAYLTFDDGVSKNTEKILEILAKYDVKATFFPNWKEGNDELYKKIADGGHALGNHTSTHEWKDVYSSIDGFKSEVETLNDNIERITGKRPTLFRFPGGSNNTIHRNYNTEIIPAAIGYLNDQGITYVDWNVDSGDASSNTPLSPEKLTENVLGTLLRKSVILMHDTNAKPTTVEALPAIIEGLKERGYKFEILSDDVKVQFVKS